MRRQERGRSIKLLRGRFHLRLLLVPEPTGFECLCRVVGKKAEFGSTFEWRSRRGESKDSGLNFEPVF